MGATTPDRLIELMDAAYQAKDAEAVAARLAAPSCESRVVGGDGVRDQRAVRCDVHLGEGAILGVGDT